ncbi:helix-turn-helix domain-containing protein [Lactobacillus crispatus]|uniref:helix-turn-helix domain-containing protein n=1 Tax=Lactobacillus crispatus TaxID=47770 RepID=UPI003975AFC7
MQISIPEKVIARAIQQQYFNKTEAANFCGVSKSTFRNWVLNHGDELIPTSVDGQLLYSREMLADFMKGHEMK